jgi:hypothetical protein
MMQANLKRAILQQPKLVARENGRTELTARSKSKSNHADQTNKANTSHVFHQALPMHDPRIHHRSPNKLQHQVKSTKRHCLGRAEHNTKQKASRQQIQAQIHGTNQRREWQSNVEPPAGLKSLWANQAGQRLRTETGGNEDENKWIERENQTRGKWKPWLKWETLTQTRTRRGREISLWETATRAAARDGKIFTRENETGCDKSESLTGAARGKRKMTARFCSSLKSRYLSKSSWIRDRSTSREPRGTEKSISELGKMKLGVGKISRGNGTRQRANLYAGNSSGE